MGKPPQTQESGAPPIKSGWPTTRNFA